MAAPTNRGCGALITDSWTNSNRRMYLERSDWIGIARSISIVKVASKLCKDGDLINGGAEARPSGPALNATRAELLGLLHRFFDDLAELVFAAGAEADEDFFHRAVFPDDDGLRDALYAIFLGRLLLIVIEQHGERQLLRGDEGRDFVFLLIDADCEN